MAYTPPPGNAVNFTFGGIYTPPTSPITFDLAPPPPGTLYAAGTDTSAFGLPSCYNLAQYITASGADFLSFGSATAYNLTQIISAFGFSAITFGDARSFIPLSVFATGLSTQAIGSPTITNFLQVAAPAGISGQSFGGALVYNLNQTIRFQPGLLAQAFGSANVELSRNYIRPNGIGAIAVGQAFIAFDIQYARPPSIQPQVIGNASVINRNAVVRPVVLIGTVFGAASVGTDQYLSVPGINSFAMSYHEVADSRQWLFVSGRDDSGFGFPTALNVTQMVRPYGLIQSELGRAELYNLRQFLYASTRDEDFPEQFGSVFVYNVNQSIGAFGEDMLRMRPYHILRTSGDPLLAAGTDHSEFGSQLVSHRDRSIFPAGASTAAVEDRLYVYNDATPVYGSGFDASDHGAPYVWSNLQQLDYIGLRETTAIGSPFVAHAIRRIVPGVAIDGIVEQPSVLLWKQYVTPSGIDAYETSATRLFIHRLAVQTLGYVYSAVGSATVRNRNRELGLYGVIQTAFGAAYLRRSFDAYSAGGGELSAFGAHAVEHRTKTLRPFGFDPSAVNHLARLVKFPPDPPGPRIVTGIGNNLLQFGNVAVSGNSIMPAGIYALTSGQPNILGHTIMPRGIFEDFIADTRPSLNRTQWIRCRDDMETMLCGKHDMKPRTIWCTPDVTQQALDNHDGAVFHHIDSNTLPRPGPGMPAVSSSVRTLQVLFAEDTSRFGSALVGPRPWITRPDGKKTEKFGIPVLPSGILPKPFGFDAARFGSTFVAIYEAPNTTKTVRPDSFAGTRFGVTWASTSPQAIVLAGASTLRIGDARVNRQYPPFTMPGISVTEFGDPFVAYRVRHIPVEGEDTATIGSELGSFALRMRVISRSRASAASFVSSEFGLASVSYGARFIYASDIVGVVGTPHILNQIDIETVGAASDTFGAAVVDVVEAGKVKPIGFVSDTCGIPMMRETISPAVMLVTRIGAVRVANGVSAVGISEAQIGHHVVIGDSGHVCGMASRAVAPHGFIATVIPTTLKLTG